MKVSKITKSASKFTKQFDINMMLLLVALVGLIVIVNSPVAEAYKKRMVETFFQNTSKKQNNY